MPYNNTYIYWHRERVFCFFKTVFYCHFSSVSFSFLWCFVGVTKCDSTVYLHAQPLHIPGNLRVSSMHEHAHASTDKIRGPEPAKKKIWFG